MANLNPISCGFVVTNGSASAVERSLELFPTTAAAGKAGKGALARLLKKLQFAVSPTAISGRFEFGGPGRGSKWHFELGGLSKIENRRVDFAAEAVSCVAQDQQRVIGA
jgi:hypothetical protein